jgi:hypothetical protein
MRTIRASEISSFLYCNRAWWYQHQGIESAKVEELATGAEFHHRHGRVIFASNILRMLAYGLLLAAVVAFAMYATNLFL